MIRIGSLARYERAVATLDDLDSEARLSRTLRDVALATLPSGVVVRPWDYSIEPARIGVVSGSFNPLTRAHVALSEAARWAGGLDAILWVVPVASIGKEDGVRAGLVDRVAQLSAYTVSSGDALAVVNRGLYAEQARIIQTLVRTQSELVFVAGFDRALAIFDPTYYDDRDAALDLLFTSASLLVAPRDDRTQDDLAALLTRAENRRYHDQVSFCALDRRYMGDSSSEARALVARGGAARRLRQLLTPEGLALAWLPDVYAPGPVATGQGVDLYAERLRLIARAAGTETGIVADAGITGWLAAHQQGS